MTPKDETDPQIEVIKKKAEPAPEPGVHEHDRHRKHGYRGYPNNPSVGGAIHTGTGFAGIGAPDGGAGSSGGGILGEKTKESIEELGEDDEER